MRKICCMVQRIVLYFSNLKLAFFKSPSIYKTNISIYKFIGSASMSCTVHNFQWKMHLAHFISLAFCKPNTGLTLKLNYVPLYNLFFQSNCRNLFSSPRFAQWQCDSIVMTIIRVKVPRMEWFLNGWAPMLYFWKSNIEFPSCLWLLITIQKGEKKKIVTGRWSLQN